MTIRRNLPLPVVLFLILSCGGDDDPMTVPSSELELFLISGDGQFAPAGRTLPEPLAVGVRRRTSGLPVPNVTVVFSITSGPGATLNPVRVVTAASGTATTELTMGASVGESRVFAEVEDDTAPGVEFQAFSVLPPVLDQVPSGIVGAGDTIALGGMNFSPIARHNVVLFSGMRGEVLASTSTALTVRVPECLPTRSVDVSVWLVGEGGTSLPMDVSQTAEALALAPGEDAVLEDPEALSCLRLASGEASEYLVVAQATGAVGGGAHSYRFRGLTGLGLPLVEEEGVGFAIQTSRRHTPPPADIQGEWDAHLRRLEAALPRSESVRAVPGLTVSRVPELGEQRTFQVLTPDQSLAEVTAIVRFVSAEAVFFEDVEAAGSVPSGELKTLAELFDDPIHPTDVSVFGEASDLDANERIVVLLTPAVNRLTPRGSPGFIGGFFFGLDLRPELENSNGGEVFFVLVPDPDGVWSDPRSLDVIRDEIPAILAHELQHMIHFNQRVLRLGAERTDALWLSEALAQMAEDVTGEVMAARGDLPAAALFQSGNYRRAQVFLPDPAEVSLIVSAGQGTLEERGAGWLFLRYLRDRSGGNQLLTGLTQSTTTGIANVTAATGLSWESAFSDWSTALAIELEVELNGLVTKDELHFSGIDLLAVLGGAGDSDYPLVVDAITEGDFLRDGRVLSAASAYFRLRSTDPGGVALTISAQDGGPLDPTAGLRLRIIRIS